MATLDELSTALRNADAAGDADAARALAAEITKMRAQPSVGEDVAKSAAIAVPEGVIGGVGALGDAQTGMRSLGDWVGDKLGLPRLSPENEAKLRASQPNFPTSAGIKGAVEGVTGKFYESKTPEGRYTRAAVSTAANPISYAGPGGPLGKAALAMTAGVGGEFGGQAGGVPGAIAGSILAPMAARRIANPGGPVRDPAHQAAVRALETEGVDSLTAGQRTGSKGVQYAESILGDAIGAGQGATRIQQEGNRQFARAAARRVDESGALPDAGPQSLAANYARHQREYADLSARNTLVPDIQFRDDILNAARNYVALAGQQGAKPIVQNTINNIVDIAQRNGSAIPGATYQNLRSQADKVSKTLRSADPATSEAMRDIRRALDSAMGRSISPQDRAQWMRTNREYGNQKDLAKAATMAGAVDQAGHVTPAGLRSSAASYNRPGWSRGQGDFYDLAENASRVMKPLPNSGTAQRAAVTHGLLAASGGVAGYGAGGYEGMLAGLVGPAALGRLLMSRPAQAAISRQSAPADNNRRLGDMLRALAAQ